MVEEVMRTGVCRVMWWNAVFGQALIDLARPVM
jgi:hypothetical protein